MANFNRYSFLVLVCILVVYKYVESLRMHKTVEYTVKEHENKNINKANYNLNKNTCNNGDNICNNELKHENIGKEQSPINENNLPDLKNGNNEKGILNNILISESTLDSSKEVCEFVVMKNNYFKSFCAMTHLYKDILKLKNTSSKLYDDVTNISYENGEISESKVLKSDGDKKIVIENDAHNPKISILYMFEKLCVGGIPLACANILKVDNVFDINQYGNEINDKELNDINIENDLINSEDSKNTFVENVSDLTE
ncbi:rhoptry neck protein 12, putative [Plasmodium berghei]|uniref:Rhoptry neck protein 12 n=2 Tax=Plasmodium berghei TaxID=5821 RepID=A0A509AIJ3_PLABA|nr:rhoptry neck protein 12 [Plasmodium berghei ANKA]CXI06667.1 rhoptry neck protein 12, putative [Plasmodium berghei]SCL92496.1 rhoptry neck protein 12, putative [Plasmodium berghei]SCM15649.1 rhoptry neck protein 12, putative [Plasmodium berghei]SCM17443.1 rhoptry neck protein 12, putative [Plasmodium berghei]SCN22785.1 rhoptry neck protein 12, putative [Plasmodium berghei]|eukprot:XP_034420254.1 rhoptry neck protein 12 [Plasmodium berghei ANKA]